MDSGIMNRIELVMGDITLLEVEAIVNAANRSLLGGGGVDGAIHRAAGPGLLEACRLLNGCETGDAKITPGFRLKANYVIHAVGPVWQGGDKREEVLLASCYRRSLMIAAKQGCRTIAFPNISTGIYRFPKEKAAGIAVREVTRFLEQSPLPETVTFACYDEENYQLYRTIVKREWPDPSLT